MELPPKEKGFSVTARVRSFTHAGRGLALYVKTTHNAWIHITLAIVSLCAGAYFDIPKGEWLTLILTIGFVLTTEAINSAIEIDIDLTSPGYHPHARDTKDIAAGAVLLASLVAVVVGIIIFYPYVRIYLG